jgi:hypothetical protein
MAADAGMFRLSGQHLIRVAAPGSTCLQSLAAQRSAPAPNRGMQSPVDMQQPSTVPLCQRQTGCLDPVSRIPVLHKRPATPLRRCLQGDVRKADDCARWAEETARHFGGLDILVNCAAGNFLAAAEALSPNGFRTGRSSLVSDDTRSQAFVEAAFSAHRPFACVPPTPCCSSLHATS